MDRYLVNVVASSSTQAYADMVRELGTCRMSPNSDIRNNSHDVDKGCGVCANCTFKKFHLMHAKAAYPIVVHAIGLANSNWTYESKAAFGFMYVSMVSDYFMSTIEGERCNDACFDMMSGTPDGWDYDGAVKAYHDFMWEAWAEYRKSDIRH